MNPGDGSVVQDLMNRCTATVQSSGGMQPCCYPALLPKGISAADGFAGWHGTKQRHRNSVTVTLLDMIAWPFQHSERSTRLWQVDECPFSQWWSDHVQ